MKFKRIVGEIFLTSPCSEFTHNLCDATTELYVEFHGQFFPYKQQGDIPLFSQDDDWFNDPRVIEAINEPMTAHTREQKPREAFSMPSFGLNISQDDGIGCCHDSNRNTLGVVPCV